MLRAAVDAYLATLSEREFDQPFLSLLTAHGYTDVHFLHGPFEFGKDFIAKREEAGTYVQYLFQTKGGDIGTRQWRQVRGQIDTMRTSTIAHPAFDATLVRRAVLATTGHLVGGAPAEAQQYRDHLVTLGELGFETWERGDLAELMASLPDDGFAAFAEGELLVLLGQIDQGACRDEQVERYSRRWILPSGSTDGLWRAAFEAAVVAHRLRQNDRSDLACHTAACLVRGAWASLESGNDEAVATTVADLGRSLYRLYGSEVVDRTAESPLRSVVDFVKAGGQRTVRIPYPVMCLRLLEILGMVCLDEQSEFDQRLKAATAIKQLVKWQPGASHPLSDHWAVSIVPAALVLSRVDPITTNSWLRSVAVWLCDNYETGVGLAPMYASAEVEASYVLGQVVPALAPHRQESYLATVLLDLLTVLRLRASFTDVRNDIRAVEVFPINVESDDDVSQYLVDGPNLIRESNVQYDESWPTPAAHHIRGPNQFRLQRLGRPWDQLVVSTVVRDRHFMKSWPTLLELAGQLRS